MQTAIISDIHANLEALEVVLGHIRAKMIRRVVCLGDIIGYGPNPRECIELLMDVPISLMGNHEEAVMFYGEDFNPKAREAIEWTKDQLNSPDHDRTRNYELWNFLGNMKEFVEEGDVYYVHASPRQPTKEYVVPQDCRNREKMDGIFAMVKRVCFLGHSHIPGIYTEDYKFGRPDKIGMQYRLREKKVLVNTGSVGQPRDGDPRASYVTFDGTTVKFHRLEYDIEKTVAKIHAAEGLPNFLADRLRVGR